MRKDVNRTFFFIETEGTSGSTVYRVGSDFAPVWEAEYTSLGDAVEAVKRRNKTATGFKEIRNGLVVQYN